MHKKGFSILLFVLSIPALAKPVSIECPSPESIQFQLQHPAPAWNEYFARGQMKIISGAYHSFILSSYTDAKSADILEWVTLKYGDGYTDFICNYQGVDDKNDFTMLVLSEPEAQPELKDCHFETGDSSECDANETKCKIICNRI